MRFRYRNVDLVWKTIDCSIRQGLFKNKEVQIWRPYLCNCINQVSQRKKNVSYFYRKCHLKMFTDTSSPVGTKKLGCLSNQSNYTVSLSGLYIEQWSNKPQPLLTSLSVSPNLTHPQPSSDNFIQRMAGGCFVFLGKTLHSHSVSLHAGIYM